MISIESEYSVVYLVDNNGVVVGRVETVKVTILEVVDVSEK